jgi:hypothetical protein
MYAQEPRRKVSSISIGVGGSCDVGETFGYVEQDIVG